MKKLKADKLARLAQEAKKRFDAVARLVAAKRYRDPENGRVWIQIPKSGTMLQDEWFYDDDPGAWHVWRDTRSENLWWSHPNGRCFWATAR